MLFLFFSSPLLGGCGIFVIVELLVLDVWFSFFAGQEASIRHAMSHLPARCRVFFAPDTDVKDHAGRYYKYANKPLGMMKWLQAGSVPPTATVALIYPDFFFLRPLWRGPASAIVASTA